MRVLGLAHKTSDAAGPGIVDKQRIAVTLAAVEGKC